VVTPAELLSAALRYAELGYRVFPCAPGNSASGVYVIRAKAGRERTVIDQPSLSIFGTAVPKQFYEALSLRLLTNGFLARLSILECRRRGAGRRCSFNHRLLFIRWH
jgi:hypothetical protein